MLGCGGNKAPNIVGDEGIVSIHVTNNGNVDARRLPQFAAAHESGTLTSSATPT
jgi:hypothetical protein